MNKTLLKQIWNERRSNAFLWVELFVVFVVLWYIVDVVYVTLRIYYMPMGFDIENTYVLRIDKMTPKAAAFQPGQTIEDDVVNLHEIVDRLAHRPDIEAVSMSHNCIPYNEGANSYSFLLDSVRINCLLRMITPDYFRVFRYRNINGKGAETLSQALTNASVVMSVDVADYQKKAPVHGRALLGQKIKTEEDQDVPFRIAALSEPVRYDHFSAPGDFGSRYTAVYMTDDFIRRLGVTYLEICIRVREGQNEGFTERLMADADRLYQVGNLYIMDVSSLENRREACEMDKVNELRTQFCVMFFLLLNIFLGIIGTFWFRTQHRRPEVALLMALGSSRRGIRSRLIGEGIVLLLISTIPAIVLTLNLGKAEVIEVGRMSFTVSRYLATIGITFLLMAVMIVAGIWYPARQAMKVQPAEALHEE